MSKDNNKVTLVESSGFSKDLHDTSVTVSQDLYEALTQLIGGTEFTICSNNKLRQLISDAKYKVKYEQLKEDLRLVIELLNLD